MRSGTKWLLCVVVVAVAVLVIYYFSINAKSKKSESNYIDYDGDNYEGTASYLGDYDTMVNETVRKNSYSRPTILFKVTEKTNILKYERNAIGDLTLIQTGRNYGKGAQVNVYKDSLMYPIVRNDNSFVETVGGNWIRLKNISRV